MADELTNLAEKMAEREPAHCPKCNERISIAVLAKAIAETMLTFSITPKPGQLLDVETVGGVLTNASKLLKAIGKELGTDTQVMLRQAVTHEDGKMDFHLVIARTEKRTRASTTAEQK